MSETPELSAAIVNGISSSTCVLVFGTTCHVPIACLASQMAVDACALTEPLLRQRAAAEAAHQRLDGGGFSRRTSARCVRRLAGCGAASRVYMWRS